METATTDFYTPSLHDALPIWRREARKVAQATCNERAWTRVRQFSTITRPNPMESNHGRQRTTPRQAAAAQPELRPIRDRKSTRLNSSHLGISYAVFCLKKKKT